MKRPVTICLFTDYGLGGPWVGQLHARIRAELPEAAVVDLQHDLPPFRPRGAGILLCQLLDHLPEEAMVVAVVDPGVGTERGGLVVRQGQRTLVGPDNGLFAPLLGTASELHRLDWRPADLSNTFHGRDWFLPAAIRLARNQPLDSTPVPADCCVGWEWGALLPEVIYVDRFGNLLVGVPAEHLPATLDLNVRGHWLRRAETFAEVSPDEPFWHINSIGLLELAVNRGSAAELLELGVGDEVPGLAGALIT